MTARSLAILLFCWILRTTMGSEPDPSSVLGIRDSVTSLQQKVLQLEGKMSSMEDSLALMIRGENEQMLITVLDKMAKDSKNYASIDKVSELGEALRKELQALLSPHISRIQVLEERVAQRDDVTQVRHQLNKLSKQVEDFESLVTCVSEPPSPQNGRPLDFERKHGSEVGYTCNRNFVATGSSTVRCHFGKWEGYPPVCKYFDATFTLRAQYGWNRFIYVVTCSSEDNYQKIKFSRDLGNGSAGALPTGAKTYLRGKEAFLNLSSVSVPDRRGLYHCEFARDGKTTRIPVMLHRYDTFVTRMVASPGDKAENNFGWGNDPVVRWVHDGKPVPAWNGRGSFLIPRVRASDAGMYEVYQEGNREDTNLFMSLVVRGCRANMFGEQCDQECPPCYNGGTCHDRIGVCICNPGFEGKNCEVACGRNRVGPNCSESCDGTNCRRQIFCKPEPSGCNCASGYDGNTCEITTCPEGKYGSNCHQTCHCAHGSCNPSTGACSGGCAQGWTGQSCQISGGN